MNSDNNNGASFLKAIAGWLKGCQIAVYVRGRQKPMTGLSVCGVYPSVLVCRANSSTHLIPREQIVTIRFMPDSEPGRNVNHPLHSLVAQKGTQPINGSREVPAGPRDYAARR
ncbi:hypothetical protein ES703_25772 [subsurface metagenome]